MCDSQLTWCKACTEARTSSTFQARRIRRTRHTANASLEHSGQIGQGSDMREVERPAMLVAQLFERLQQDLKRFPASASNRKQVSRSAKEDSKVAPCDAPAEPKASFGLPAKKRTSEIV